MQIALSSADTAAVPKKGFNAFRPSTPYRSTRVFDEHSLPLALKREHRTKPGVWAVIRMLYGHLLYYSADDGPPLLVTAAIPLVIAPQKPHHVVPVASMSMQIDFYDHQPSLPP